MSDASAGGDRAGGDRAGGDRAGGDRTRHFPAIEKRYGHPVAHWFEVLTASGCERYPDQMAVLQAGHGFSRTHANALVMTFRGSPSARRVADLEGFRAGIASEAVATLDAILTAAHTLAQALTTASLETVIAWNQPMVRSAAGYVLGLSVARNHLTLNPFSTAALEAAAEQLAGYKVNRHTFQVPLGWEVDIDLLRTLISVRLAELGGAGTVG